LPRINQIYNRRSFFQTRKHDNNIRRIKNRGRERERGVGKRGVGRREVGKREEAERSGKRE